MNDIFGKESQPLQWHFNRPSARSEAITKIRRLAKLLNISLHSIDTKNKSYRTMVEDLVEAALKTQAPELNTLFPKATVSNIAERMRMDPPKSHYGMAQKLRMAM